MAYIPKKHEKYDLLPFRRKHGGEVFEYPCNLISQLKEYIQTEEILEPYGLRSYEEYDAEIDRIAQRFADQPVVMELFSQFKAQVHEMNCKEEWSVVRYIGPENDSVLGLTPGRNYYWPSRFSNPVYVGVIDDEEYTSYLYPTDPDLWEIHADPTGMAFATIYGGKNNGKIQKT